MNYTNEGKRGDRHLSKGRFVTRTLSDGTQSTRKSKTVCYLCDPQVDFMSRKQRQLHHNLVHCEAGRSKRQRRTERGHVSSGKQKKVIEAAA